MSIVPLKLEYSDVHDRAAPIAPFSNATEGDAWQERWCFTCRHDSCGVPTAKHAVEVYCPIYNVAIMDRTPAEFADPQPGSLPNRYRCTRYEPRPGEQDARKTAPNPTSEVQ